MKKDQLNSNDRAALFKRVLRLENEAKILGAMIALGWKGGELTSAQRSRGREVCAHAEAHLARSYIITGENLPKAFL